MTSSAVPGFGDWIAAVFDQPVTDSVWDRDDDPMLHRIPLAGRVDRATRLFLDAGALLAPYSDDQVALGLSFLCGEGMADASAFLSREVAEPAALAYVDAMPELFRKVFAPRCGDGLGHLSEPLGRLGSCCYMWWDVSPWMPCPEEPARRAIDRHMLAALAALLEIPSAACQEAALHGLGHAHFRAPAETERLIDRYLASGAAARPELVRYARAARRGCVN